jgi:hypothetical protein
MSAGVTLTSLAQARYALFEKLQKCKDSLSFALQVFPEDSANVIFWRGEVERVGAALIELGGVS